MSFNCASFFVYLKRSAISSPFVITALFRAPLPALVAVHFAVTGPCSPAARTVFCGSCDAFPKSQLSS